MPNRSNNLPVLPSLRTVEVQRSQVRFHPEQLETAVRKWGEFPAAQNPWHHPCHYFDGTTETLRWIFVLDLLNYCFWPDANEPTWTVSYGGENYSGYWGLKVKSLFSKSASRISEKQAASFWLSGMETSFISLKRQGIVRCGRCSRWSLLSRVFRMRPGTGGGRSYFGSGRSFWLRT